MNLDVRNQTLETGFQRNKATLLDAYLAFFSGGRFVPPAPNPNVIGYMADVPFEPDAVKRFYPQWTFDTLSYKSLLFPSTVTVPNLVGLDINSALVQLQNATLIGATIYADGGLAFLYNQVTAQDVPAGTQVGQGSVVNLTVQDLVQVPNLVGLSQSAALAALSAANLGANVINKVSVPPLGIVLSQSFPAGTQVALSTVVTITVSVNGDGFRVCAVTAGWYNGTFYNVGDTFDLLQASDFSDASLNYEIAGGEYTAGWMTQVAPSAALTQSDGTAVFPVPDPNRRFVE